MMGERDIRDYSELHDKRQGGATPADNPKSTPVADNHRAPKAFQPPSRCADEAKLTPVGGVPPPRLLRNAEYCKGALQGRRTLGRPLDAPVEACLATHCRRIEGRKGALGKVTRLYIDFHCTHTELHKHTAPPRVASTHRASHTHRLSHTHTHTHTQHTGT